MFEEALSGRERLMVYTKKDLAQGTLNNAVGWYSPRINALDSLDLACCSKKR